MHLILSVFLRILTCCSQPLILQPVSSGSKTERTQLESKSEREKLDSETLRMREGELEDASVKSKCDSRSLVQLQMKDCHSEEKLSGEKLHNTFK